MVAAWYLRHGDRAYPRGGHCLDLLIRDAEKLRTEWATGRRSSATAARQEDRRHGNAQALEGALAKIREANGRAGNGQ